MTIKLIFEIIDSFPKIPIDRNIIFAIVFGKLLIILKTYFSTIFVF